MVYEHHEHRDKWGEALDAKSILVVAFQGGGLSELQICWDS